MNSRKFRHPNQVKTQLSVLGWIVGKTHQYMAFALLLIYFIATCGKSYAIPPEMAIIKTVHGSRLTVFPNGRNSEPQSARVGMELREFRGILTIPGNNESKAGLMLVDAKRQAVNNTAQTLFLAGPKNTPTEYSLSCKIAVGAATVGFSKGQPPCDKGVIVTAYRNIVAQLPVKNLLKAEASVDMQYCSAVAASGKTWAISSSQKPSEDPCQQATEKCLQASSGEECDLASMGEWNVSDPELLASIQCANNVAITRKGDGQTVANDLLPLLEQMGKAFKTACAFHVYKSEDIVVSRASNNPALVQVYDAGNGNLAIDVLAGDVNIVSARIPQGRRVEKGYGYRQKEDSITMLNCREKFNSESIQEFLQPATWLQSSESVTEQLKAYRSDFCQSVGQSENRGNDWPSFPWQIIPFPSPGNPDRDRQPPRNPDIPRVTPRDSRPNIAPQ